MFRKIVKMPALVGLVIGLSLPAFSKTQEYSLVIDKETVNITGTPLKRITINGSIPGPTLNFTEGDEAVIHVTNKMAADTSVHWHGLLVPAAMDGVPGLSGFPGIKPGETFTYRFNVRQHGTYWYHAHSRAQEQDGHYGSIIIHPKGGDRISVDRDYVVLLSDFHEDEGNTIMANLKKSSEYYAYTRRTLGDFFADVRERGLGEAWRRAMPWGRMRMMSTDLADISNYTFLVNGKTPDQNWTGIFKPGEKVRLRFINASAMSFYDVRVPGLKMTVVASDGQPVEPVRVDEFRFGVAETYDVIAEPGEDKAYTIVAEPIDRTGFALATLAPREGMRGASPEARPRSLLTMADMGMAHDMMGGMDHSGHGMHGMHGSGHGGMHGMHGSDHGGMHGMHDSDHGGMHGMHDSDHGGMHGMHDSDHGGMHGMHGSGHGGMHGMHDSGHGMTSTDSPARDFDTGVPGSGWADAGTPKGHTALAYKDLRYAGIQKDQRIPGREIIVRLGGNMERYVWTLNGKKYEDSGPINLQFGERVRLTFINDTMMAHPMHLHGMFVQLENGQPMSKLPNKHTVNVAPGDTYSALLTADEAGEWAFHCHLLYHVVAGMMNKVVVAKLDKSQVPIRPHSSKAQNRMDHGEPLGRVGLTKIDYSNVKP